MKNRTIICILLMLILALFLIPAASADSFENPVYTPEFIAEQEGMLRQKEQYFPRFIFQETFDVASKPAISKPGDGYYRYEMVRAGKHETMIATYRNNVKGQGWGESHFNTTGAYEDFYMSIEVQMLERDDSKTGYLWFQYTDVNLVGANNRKAVTIEFPNRIRSYITGSSGVVETIRYDLSEFKNDYQVHKIEVMRLDGYARIYIDGHFLTGFEDGFSGKFYQLYGVGLEEGGKYAAGLFDNFILRVR